MWTRPSHLARSRPKGEVSPLWLVYLTPTPMASCSPFLSRDRIWLGRQAIFCLDQLIFFSPALDNQTPSGPSTGTWRFPGKQYQARNQASAENWRQKLEEGQKYSLPLPHLLKLSPLPFLSTSKTKWSSIEMEAECLWLKLVQTEKPRHPLIQTGVKEAARIRGRQGQAS